jgi:hypothetical protein
LGQDNFAADRRAAAAIARAAPEAPVLATENRKFLRRGVAYLAGQFLDIGTGLPARGNVHQVAQAASPAARVVYADNDPVVATYSRALKTGAGTAVIQAGLRDAQAIWDHPATRDLIDLRRPVALLMAAVLHFISDQDDPYGCVAAFCDPLPCAPRPGPGVPRRRAGR